MELFYFKLKKEHIAIYMYTKNLAEVCGDAVDYNHYYYYEV